MTEELKQNTSTITFFANTCITSEDYPCFEGLGKDKKGVDSWFNRYQIGKSIEQLSTVYPLQDAYHTGAGSVHIELEFDKCNTLEWIRIQNGKNKRTWYGKITHFNQVNANTTQIYFAIDWVATFWDTLEIGNANIHRRSEYKEDKPYTNLAHDGVGVSTQLLNIHLGDLGMDTNKSLNDWVYDKVYGNRLDNPWFCAVSNLDKDGEFSKPHLEWQAGNIIPGFATVSTDEDGFQKFLAKHIEYNSSFLSYGAPNLATIKQAYIMPHNFLGSPRLLDTSSALRISERLNNPYEGILTDKELDTLDHRATKVQEYEDEFTRSYNIWLKSGETGKKKQEQKWSDIKVETNGEVDPKSITQYPQGSPEYKDALQDEAIKYDIWRNAMNDQKDWGTSDPDIIYGKYKAYYNIQSEGVNQNISSFEALQLKPIVTLEKLKAYYKSKNQINIFPDYQFKNNKILNYVNYLFVSQTGSMLVSPFDLPQSDTMRVNIKFTGSIEGKLTLWVIPRGAASNKSLLGTKVITTASWPLLYLAGSMMMQYGGLLGKPFNNFYQGAMSVMGQGYTTNATKSGMFK